VKRGPRAGSIRPAILPGTIPGARPAEWTGLLLRRPTGLLLRAVRCLPLSGSGGLESRPDLLPGKPVLHRNSERIVSTKRGDVRPTPQSLWMVVRGRGKKPAQPSARDAGQEVADVTAARRYSRLRRAMLETEIASGQAASHS